MDEKLRGKSLENIGYCRDCGIPMSFLTTFERRGLVCLKCYEKKQEEYGEYTGTAGTQTMAPIPADGTYPHIYVNRIEVGMESNGVSLAQGHGYLIDPAGEATEDEVFFKVMDCPRVRALYAHNPVIPPILDLNRCEVLDCEIRTSPRASLLRELIQLGSNHFINLDEVD